jgi:hypothetical protein
MLGPKVLGRGSRFAPIHGYALPTGRVFKKQESPGVRAGGGSLWLLSIASFFVGGVSLPGGATYRDNPEQAKMVPGLIGWLLPPVE